MSELLDYYRYKILKSRYNTERVEDIINKCNLNSRRAFYFQNWLERV